MSYGIDRRHNSDPVLLWLWCRPATVALIRPLAWEHPYAAGVALKSKIIIIIMMIVAMMLPLLCVGHWTQHLPYILFKHTTHP